MNQTTQKTCFNCAHALATNKLLGYVSPVQIVCAHQKWRTRWLNNPCDTRRFQAADEETMTRRKAKQEHG